VSAPVRGFRMCGGKGAGRLGIRKTSHRNTAHRRGSWTDSAKEKCLHRTELQVSLGRSRARTGTPSSGNWGKKNESVNDWGNMLRFLQRWKDVCVRRWGGTYKCLHEEKARVAEGRKIHPGHAFTLKRPLKFRGNCYWRGRPLPKIKPSSQVQLGREGTRTGSSRLG